MTIEEARAVAQLVMDLTHGHAAETFVRLGAVQRLRERFPDIQWEFLPYAGIVPYEPAQLAGLASLSSARVSVVDSEP